MHKYSLFNRIAQYYILTKSKIKWRISLLRASVSIDKPKNVDKDLDWKWLFCPKKGAIKINILQENKP